MPSASYRRAAAKMNYLRRPYQITSQKALRATFWEQNPHLIRSKRNGDYPVDTRMAFVDYIDHMARSEVISQELARRATL